MLYTTSHSRGDYLKFPSATASLDSCELLALAYVLVRKSFRLLVVVYPESI